jgi:hypothetical protein
MSVLVTVRDCGDIVVTGAPVKPEGQPWSIVFYASRCSYIVVRSQVVPLQPHSLTH